MADSALGSGLINLAGPVWLVIGKGKGRFPHCYGILIQDRDTALIDPGAGPGIIKHVLEKYSPDLVLNTHTHLDHCAQAHMFESAEVLVPAEGLATAGNLELLSRRFVGPQIREAWRKELLEWTSFKDFKPSGAFQPWQEIKVGRTLLRMIPAPGHTADHYLIHLPHLDILLSADIDLTAFGPWYGNPESSLKQMRESIGLARSLAPRMVVSAHRSPVTQDLPQAFDRYAAVTDQRDQRLLDFLHQERTWQELLACRFVYGEFQSLDSEILDYFERNMLSQHLAELMDRGQVVQGSKGYRRA